MFFTTFAVACGLAAGANAHITMAFPSPFTAPAQVTQAPIVEDTFPCQAGDGSYAGPTNTMSLGAEVDLKFNGQAVHGGGSCQISITYDKVPTKASTWKVIKSFEGGCPARNTPGNLGDDTSATAPVPFDYNVTIPDNIPAGSGTLAWTWLNKVGNREFYMNCAAVELAGTGGDESNYNALPDMFVANLGGSDTCVVGTGDFLYPAPGDVVEFGNGEEPSGSDVATTAGVCTVGVSGGSGSGSGSGATATGAGTAASATADSAPAGGVFATSNAAAPTAAVTSETVASPAAASVTAAASAAGSSSSGSTTTTTTTSGSASTGACTTDGEMVCLGSTYQVCASGQWSVAMALAGGTECTGTGASFKIAASSSKKSKFRRSREERAKRGLGLMA